MTFRNTSFSLLAWCMLLPGGLAAQSDYLKFRIDGATNPEGIPTWVKIDHFMRTYTGGDLIEELNRRDRSVLLRAMKEVSWIKGVNTVLELVRQENLVCPMLSTTSDAATIAAYVQEIGAQDEAHLQRAYDALLERLSVNGRAQLLSHIDKNVVPKIVYQKTDYPRLAAANADMYLRNKRLACESSLRGELVVEVVNPEGNPRLTKKQIR